MIVGIIGVETIYGRDMGTFRVLDSLSTLAFDYPETPNRVARQKLFRDQLADALRAALATLEVDPMPEVIQLEQPARREHGDWSSNVALATAKRAGRNPDRKSVV